MRYWRGVRRVEFLWSVAILAQFLLLAGILAFVFLGVCEPQSTLTPTPTPLPTTAPLPSATPAPTPTPTPLPTATPSHPPTLAPIPTPTPTPWVLYIPPPPRNLLQLLDKPWVSDGITPLESEIIAMLNSIARSGESIDGEPAYLLIKDMPFMETIEYGDLFILKGLNSLAWRDYLQRIVSHPSLSDGITDEWASLFSVVPDVVSSGRGESRFELLDTLFDPERTLLEERTITLPLAGDVKLAVIQADVRAPNAAGARTMEMLEQVVRSQEEFMGLAFPQNHVTLVVDDFYVRGTRGTNTIILTDYPENRETIAHRTAHKYWDWHWFGEMASFLSMVSRTYDGTPLPDSELGQGIFEELYKRLGDEAFRRGFGELYLALLNDSYDAECPGDDWSACYLRTAFVEGATPEQAAIVDEVVRGALLILAGRGPKPD